MRNLAQPAFPRGVWAPNVISTVLIGALHQAGILLVRRTAIKEDFMNAKNLTKWMLAGFGAGAATAYFAHPEHGKKRRAALAFGAKKLLDKASHEGRKSLSDSQHHLAGMVAKLRTHFTQDSPSDRVLEARIRSRLGRVVSHPRAIHVVCDGGSAILWGLVWEKELPLLLEAVGDVPGVNEVTDHLEIAAPDELPPAKPDTLKEARDRIRLNWSPSKRLLVGAGGMALALHGMRRKDAFGTTLAMIGAGLAVGSTMQNRLSPSLALTPSSPGFELDRTIRIKAPVSDLFDFWVNPENYPKAFSHVTNVERLGENLYRWTLTGPAGFPVQWEGIITRIVPNTLVEWKSLPGSAISNFGIAHFDPHYDASTRINIRMFYRPPAGVVGKFFAEMLGADAHQILDIDLKRLKFLFESETFVHKQRKVPPEKGTLRRTAST